MCKSPICLSNLLPVLSQVDGIVTMVLLEGVAAEEA